MNLTETKAALADSLADAGWPVKTSIPSNIQPPLVLISPSSPYIEDGDTFGGDELILNLQVIVFPKVGSNARMEADLDKMLDALIPHFGNWSVTVDQPDLFTVQSNLYYGVMIQTSNTFRVEA